MFTFKQFSVAHDRSSMKVGTDGVLLGAWAEVHQAQRILDIGTGCGLIALMAAQRSRAMVTGIDIHLPSVEQARHNFLQSPFADRLAAVSADLRSYVPQDSFDCILSNPPFFQESLLPPNAARAAARNTALLPFPSLVQHAVRLMAPQASLQMVLPHSAAPTLLHLCSMMGLTLLRRTDVCTLPGKPPKRVLMHWVNQPTQEPIRHDMLSLSDREGQRSPQYRELTQDFYL